MLLISKETTVNMFQQTRHPVVAQLASKNQSRQKTLGEVVFCARNINALSQEISRRLVDSRADGRPTIVSDKTIIGVLDSIFYKSNANLPEIYDEVINHIVDTIEAENAQEFRAKHYDINVQTYDPVYGIARNSDIKLRTNRLTHYEPFEPRY